MECHWVLWNIILLIEILLCYIEYGILWCRIVHCDMEFNTVTWDSLLWHGIYYCDMEFITVTWYLSLWHGIYYCGMEFITVIWNLLLWHGIYYCDMEYWIILCSDREYVLYIIQYIYLCHWITYSAALNIPLLLYINCCIVTCNSTYKLWLFI